MRTDTYRLKPGTSYTIAPLLGCNMVSWKIDGKPVLYCPEGFSRKPDEFFAGGIPLLFPSVGRTWDLSSRVPVFGQYRLGSDSKVYQMPIHGIIPLGWFQKRRDQVASERVEIDYGFTIRKDFLETHYPFSVNFELKYVLKPMSMRIEAKFQNAGETPAPVAFGTHPYFYFENKDNVEVHLPCKEQLLLRDGMSIPSGEIVPMTNQIIQLKHQETCDCVFGGMTGKRATIVDKASGRKIHIDVDDSIENFVIYARGGEKFVCVEPWTKGLGAFGALYQDGWQSSGAIPMLQPGESRQIRIEYIVE
jgi:galactose mutarotase-like enzyme